MRLCLKPLDRFRCRAQLWQVSRLRIANVWQQRMAWCQISRCLDNTRTAWTLCAYLASFHLHTVPMGTARGLLM